MSYIRKRYLPLLLAVDVLCSQQLGLDFFCSQVGVGRLLFPETGVWLLLFPAAGVGRLLFPAAGVGRLLFPAAGVWLLLIPAVGVGRLMFPAAGVWRLLFPAVGVWLLLFPEVGVWLLMFSAVGVWRLLFPAAGVWRLLFPAVRVWLLLIPSAGVWHLPVLTAARQVERSAVKVLCKGFLIPHVFLYKQLNFWLPSYETMKLSIIFVQKKLDHLQLLYIIIITIFLNNSYKFITLFQMSDHFVNVVAWSFHQGCLFKLGNFAGKRYTCVARFFPLHLH